MRIKRGKEFAIDENANPALIKPPPSKMVFPGSFLLMKSPRRREEKEKNTANTPKTMDVYDAGRLYSLDTRVKNTP